MLTERNITEIINLVENAKNRSFIPKSASMCRVIMDEGRYRVLKDGTQITFHQFKLYNRLGIEYPVSMLNDKNFKQKFHSILVVDDLVFDPFNELYALTFEGYINKYDEDLTLSIDIISEATSKWIEDRREKLESLGLIQKGQEFGRKGSQLVVPKVETLDEGEKTN